MVFGIRGQDGSGTSANEPSDPNFGTIDGEGNLISEGPQWPSSGAPPQGYPENPPVQWNTNDSAVPWNYEVVGYGSADRPMRQMTGDVVNRPFYQAVNYANMLRGRANSPTATQADKDRYKDFVNDLRRYTGSKIGTVGSVETAWRTVLSDAQNGDTPALLLLNSQGGSLAGGSGGSGSGKYTGPRESVTVQAESDIRATANALALEMIGRPLNDKEIDRVTRRIRTAEQEQPQITSGTVARSQTVQGLTPQGREDILRDVIAKRPEFEQYQLDTTVMDAMNAYIQEKRQVVDV
jgi:hypothetical protein